MSALTIPRVTDRSLPCILALGAAALAICLGAPRPCLGQVTGRGLSEAERVLLRAYGVALEERSVRDVSRGSLLQQLRRNPTVAFVDGYWVAPIDLSAVLLLPEVRPAIEASLPDGPSREGAARLIADPTRLKQLTAFAFIPQGLRAPLGLRLSPEFEYLSAAEQAGPDIVIAPFRDVDWDVVEYLPPIGAGLEEAHDCYFLCGDPNTWDFDGDGVPDLRDEDNDNDGVADRLDHYPNWPVGSDCNCDAEPFVLLVTKFARGLTKAILFAHAVATNAAGTERAIALGPAPGDAGRVRFVVPPSALVPEQPASACPAPDDPAVRYVNRDADACARLRFRCKDGEVPFSTECGCGCRRP